MARLVSERERLIARIRQIRRTRTVDAGRSANMPEEEGSRLDGIERRVAHLEQLLEGLQDSVHRETQRQDTLIADLQAQIQPGAMSAALSKNARERGI